MPPVYWKEDEEGNEQVRVELYESPTPPKRDYGRYILMMVTAALTALIVSC